MIIGALPASGQASRLAGIPKFMLPLSADRTMLQWHIEQLLPVCDEICISTRSVWMGLAGEAYGRADAALKEGKRCDIYEIEPSTMSDALVKMTRYAAPEDTVVVGMPDTVFLGTTKNVYAAMVDTPGDVVVTAFACRPELRGHVGQVKLDGSRVVLAVDKYAGCDWAHMWGAMALRGAALSTLNENLPHPGIQLNSWLAQGLDVRAVECDGEYIDVGRIEGLADLYTRLTK